MQKGTLNTLILIFVIWSLCVLGCEKKQQKATPTPEVVVNPTTEEQLKAEKEIEDFFYKDYFARCQDEPKRRWFAYYQDGNKQRLVEFVNLNWALKLDGIKPVDITENGHLYHGTIIFTAYDGSDKERWSFLRQYNSNTNNWEKDAKELTFSGNKLPSQIKVEKINNKWTFNFSGGATNTFPYKKPNIPCSELLNRVSLAKYDINWGKDTSTNATNSVSTEKEAVNTNSNTPVDKTSSDSSKVEKKETPEPTSTPYEINEEDVRNVVNYFIRDFENYSSFKDALSNSYFNKLSATYRNQNLTLEEISKLNKYLNIEGTSKYEEINKNKASMEVKVFIGTNKNYGNSGSKNFYTFTFIVEKGQVKIDNISPDLPLNTNN